MVKYIKNIPPPKISDEEFKIWMDGQVTKAYIEFLRKRKDMTK